MHSLHICQGADVLVDSQSLINETNPRQQFSSTYFINLFYTPTSKIKIRKLIAMKSFLHQNNEQIHMIKHGLYMYARKLPRIQA